MTPRGAELFLRIDGEGFMEKIDYSKEINAYLELEVRILQNMDTAGIGEALNCLRNALEREADIYIFGNGGSASTATHMQNDFNKGISEYTEKKFRVHCLNDNVATVMAIANDMSFEEVFRFQLQGRLQPNDVVIAISGSGNSRNILRAVEYAKEQGCTVIGLTGFDGGNLRRLADISLHVPVQSMQITEDIHMTFNHLMMSVLCKTLCGLDHLKKEGKTENE